MMLGSCRLPSMAPFSEQEVNELYWSLYWPSHVDVVDVCTPDEADEALYEIVELF
jgi:hypothetical protein